MQRSIRPRTRHQIRRTCNEKRGLGRATRVAFSLEGVRAMRFRWNIVHLLAIANITLLLAASGVGWEVTRRYGELVFQFNAQNAQRVVDVAVTNLAWREYVRLASD